MAQTFPVPTGAEQVRWDLTELYLSPHDPALERTLGEAGRFAEDFERRYRGRIRQLAPAELVGMMEALERHQLDSSRPALYAQLLHSRDMADPTAGWLLSRVREAAAARGRHLVFFPLEIAQLSDEEVARLAADPAAARYRHAIEQHRRFRAHQLSEVQERLLTDLSPTAAGAWVRLFQELCAAIQVELDGRRAPLAVALNLWLRDPDRALRERASHALTAALEADLRTRAYVFNVLLQDKSIDDRLRGYPSWISARNLANEVSDEAVRALIEAVSGRFPLVARYYRVKRRLLGLDRLHEWDRYAPLPAAARRVFWTEARGVVVSSYRRFSPRAGDLVADFFERGWIDAPVAAGKQPGAYCAPATPQLHPYVLMNFTGELNDALTLAHELGHGLHNRLAAGRNHLFDYHPPLTLAETASVFGEALTFDALMSQERDPRVRLAMLCHQVEDAFATIFRQVAMNQFEDAAHRARRAEGELSPQRIGALWQERIQAMFGDSLALTDEHRAWWSYVEHFVHTPGYVYAYAFGNLLALAIYRRHRELEGPGFADAYLEFLELGGSLPPAEAARRVGVDLTDPALWDSGLAILEDMVAAIERLAE